MNDRSIKPGKAIWCSKEYDYEVEVYGFVGAYKGVNYYMIYSDVGTTSVPEHELVQINDTFKPLPLFRDGLIKYLAMLGIK